MAKVKFPSEMPSANNIGGNDKMMIAKEGTGETYQATFDQAKQYLTIEGQRIASVDPGALPAGPAGQTRYMEVTAVGTWTYGGVDVGSNDEGYKTTFWWTGTEWISNGVVRVKGDAPDLEGYSNLATSNKGGVKFSSGVGMTGVINLFNDDSWTFESAILLGELSGSDAQTILHLGTGNPIFFIQNSGGIPTVFVSKAGVANQISFSINGFNAGDFLHIVITFISGVYTATVNGLSKTISQEASNLYEKTSANLTIGGYNSTAQSFKGQIKLIRIYDDVLTSTEISERYNGGFVLDYISPKSSSLKFELVPNNLGVTKWIDSKGGVEVELTGNYSSSGLFVEPIETPILTSHLSVLPPTINIAVNKQLNIYYEAIIPYYKFSGLSINAVSSIGESADRSFRYTPTATGSHSVTFQVLNHNGDVLESKTITIVAISSSIGSGVKQILFIADSTIDSDPQWLDPARQKYEMLRQFNTMVVEGGGTSLKYLGTRGESPIYHQAIAGWALADFLGTSSPFYVGGAINFKAWMAQNSNFGGADAIDIVYIQLGINDLKFGSGVVTDALARMESMIAYLRHPSNGYPSCKIVISIPADCGDNNTGWVKHFSGVNYSGYLDYRFRMLEYAKGLINKFHNNPTFPNVFVSPINLFVDRHFGYPRDSFNSSSRSTEQVIEFTDSVHPSRSGYEQSADSHYSVLKSIL